MPNPPARADLSENERLDNLEKGLDEMERRIASLESKMKPLSYLYRQKSFEDYFSKGKRKFEEEKEEEEKGQKRMML